MIRSGFDGWHNLSSGWNNEAEAQKNTRGRVSLLAGRPNGDGQAVLRRAELPGLEPLRQRNRLRQRDLVQADQPSRSLLDLRLLMEARLVPLTAEQLERLREKLTTPNGVVIYREPTGSTLPIRRGSRSDERPRPVGEARALDRRGNAGRRACRYLFRLAGLGAVTAEEFERAYAERSGVTVEWLREHGRVVRPCYCGDALCEGWQSLDRTLADELDRERASR